MFAFLIFQLSLPEGVSIDVVVSSIVDAGHIFIQQPTHPSYPSLERLNQFMISCYMQDGLVPQLPRPLEGQSLWDYLQFCFFHINLEIKKKKEFNFRIELLQQFLWTFFTKFFPSKCSVYTKCTMLVLTILLAFVLQLVLFVQPQCWMAGTGLRFQQCVRSRMSVISNMWIMEGSLEYKEAHFAKSGERKV